MSTPDHTPVPDPTILTTEALARAMSAMRDYVDGQLGIRDERFRGIDTATQVLNETVNRVPTDMQKEIQHVRQVTDEKFESVQTQFQERDTRSERESRDNKVAVDAAFAAQKEAAAKQDEANAKAIDKSEKATAETIKTNQELGTSKIDALTQRLDALTLAVNSITSSKVGATQNTTALQAATALVLSAIVVGLALFAALH